MTELINEVYSWSHDSSLVACHWKSSHTNYSHTVTQTTVTQTLTVTQTRVTQSHKLQSHKHLQSHKLEFLNIQCTAIFFFWTDKYWTYDRGRICVETWWWSPAGWRSDGSRSIWSSLAVGSRLCTQRTSVQHIIKHINQITLARKCLHNLYQPWAITCSIVEYKSNLSIYSLHRFEQQTTESSLCLKLAQDTTRSNQSVRTRSWQWQAASASEYRSGSWSLKFDLSTRNSCPATY